MNRIDATFNRLKKERKKALITYIAAGDPDMETTVKLAVTLEEAGADIIELGIPFSDPLADGPTIQRASQRALESGCTVKKVIAMVKKLRKKVRVPIVFMTYYNLILNHGVERFVKDAVGCGADGLIVPDLPIEESAPLEKAADRSGFNIIQLTAPTTSISRIRDISRRSKGFIYYVSVTGVTGARKDLPPKMRSAVRLISKTASLPVCAGFGVSTSSQARKVAGMADGVIVGSAIIRIIEKNLGAKRKMVREVGKFAGSLAEAVHGERL
ncbi:MAG: tryptophan synthase subunit alpha [Candidatus Omnitrophica bacterium]|nr:tryptophan synthase subunit alpha [Candidatus Omnitrophota bacterium]